MSPLTTADVSPSTNPLKVALNVGFGVLNCRLALLTAIVSGAGVTVKSPGTNVSW